MLAQQGYLVWVCDNRSASGKGHESARAGYKNFGATELADIEDGIDWLVAQGWADHDRIGIWGWSYGGYMTAYALTHSKRFRIGIAGAPVTDWRLYDSIYTERYMDLPQANPEGYARSSVIKAAAEPARADAPDPRRDRRERARAEHAAARGRAAGGGQAVRPDAVSGQPPRDRGPEAEAAPVPTMAELFRASCRAASPGPPLPAPPPNAPRAPRPARQRFFGHPRGLATLFFTEMWERFSYYGMRAILTLFMLAPSPRAAWASPKGECRRDLRACTRRSCTCCRSPAAGSRTTSSASGESVLYGGIVIMIGHILLAMHGTADVLRGPRVRDRSARAC